MKRLNPLYSARNLRRISPALAVGIGLIVTTLGLIRGVIGSEALILGLYLVGVVAAAIAWYGNVRWKQTLWTIGMVLAAVSMAALFLTAQFWLVAGEFIFFLVIILYPTGVKRTREELRIRRLQDRQ